MDINIGPLHTSLQTLVLQAALLAAFAVAEILRRRKPAEERAASPGASIPGSKRWLHRSRRGVLAGVSLGIASYFGWEVDGVRLVFVLCTVLGGFAAVVVYLVLWFLMPLESLPVWALPESRETL